MHDWQEVFLILFVNAIKKLFVREFVMTTSSIRIPRLHARPSTRIVRDAVFCELIDKRSVKKFLVVETAGIRL